MNKIVVALVLFFAAVLMLTYMDWVVNGLLYAYGLQFNMAWFERYSFGYFLLWQFTIFTLTYLSTSWRLLVFMEAFVLSSTQDLFYFGVWNGGFPVGEWTWMPMYQTLGFYNTAFQVCLSATSMLTAVTVVVLLKKRCRCYYPDSACWRCRAKTVLRLIKKRASFN